MALERGIVEIPAAGGLAQGVDPRVIAPGSWIQADNMLPNKIGALTKRRGHDALPTTAYTGATAPETPEVIDSRGAELLIHGVSGAGGTPATWAWSETAQAWVQRDSCALATVRLRTLATSSSFAFGTRVARSDLGRVVIVWLLTADTTFLAGCTLMCRVEDADGTVLLDDTQITTTANWPAVAVVTCGETAVLVHCDTGANIKQTMIDLDTGAVSASTNVVVGTIEALDAHPYTTTHYALAYTDPATPNQVTVARVAAATSTVAATANLATTGAAARPAIAALDGVGFALACWDPGVNGVVSWRLTTVFGTAWGPTQSTTLTGAGYIYNVGTCIDSAQQVTTCATGFNDIATQDVFTDAQSYLAGGAPDSVYVQSWNVALLGHPWRRDGVPYAAIWQGVRNQPATTPALGAVCMMYPTTDGAYATVLATLGQTVLSTDSPIPAKSISLAHAPDGELLPLALYATEYTSRPALATLDYDRSATGYLVGAEQRDCLAHSGGMSTWYDGASEVEIGTLAPFIRTHTVVAGAVDVGVHQYRVEWQWVDSLGQLHHGQLGNIYEVTLGAPGGVRLEVESLALTRKGDISDGEYRNLALVVYRNTLTSPTTFFRLTPFVTGYTSTTNTWNSKAGYLVYSTDALSDAAVEALGYGYIYTFGDVAQDVPAPPSVATVTHNNRLWLISGLDQREVWASKLIVPAAGPGFSPLMVSRVESSQGATALGSLDDKLTIFTPDEIWYLSGDGPNDTGGGGSWIGPYRIMTDRGCPDARSVLAFPGGLLFWSGVGIYMLSRKLEVTFIGEPVVDVTSTAVGVIAKLDGINSRAVFLVDDGEGTNVFAIYDYRVNAWTTSTMYGPTDGLPDGEPIDAVAHHYAADDTHWLSVTSTLNPAVWRDADNGRDVDTWFPATVETPWVKVAGISGYSRAWRCVVTGERYTGHDLTVEICTDFDSTIRQSAVFATSTMAGAPVERLSLHLSTQKCSAIKAKIYDVAPGPLATTEPAWDLVGVGFEVGIKRGATKLPTTNRSGGLHGTLRHGSRRRGGLGCDGWKPSRRGRRRIRG